MKQIHKEAIYQNGDKKRFEWNVEGKTAFIEYILNNQDEIFLTHTEVPQELEGKGIGSKLVKAVLDYIKEENWTVYPTCPFVGSYIKKNEEYQSLVKKGLRY
ncbi:GNAT family N-acetyltransferase [Bernardetia sp. Wsw4-3y2]|uniref:GNAT family N-acetyltransferase n=1 Tax=Bernardetia sp. Wsw4-3y2 TaxID=3127471 RepID=UPI0030D5461B